jgi:hypothetical protein
MNLSKHLTLPLSCLLTVLLPSIASAATPLQDPVSNGGLTSDMAEPLVEAAASEPVVSEAVVSETAAGETAAGEITMEVRSLSQTPVYHTAAANNCQCSACAAKKRSAWSRYKSRKQEQYWGYPEYFEEAGFGAISTELIRPQVLRGEAARMTIYDYDFVTGTARLNPRGIRRVQQLARTAIINGQTITVESTGTEIDESRYQNVVAIAASAHLNPSQVVSGQPIAAGLGGEEALIHRKTELDNVQKYGVRQFQFEAGSGGFSTSGFSMSSGGSSSN